VSTPYGTTLNGRPTGTTGCHEYFTILAGTVASSDQLSAGPGANVNVGPIPTNGIPYVPVPPTPNGGLRRLLVQRGSNSNANPASSSDARLKEAIVPTGGLLAGLLVYSWQWNGAAKALALDWQPTTGVMAQEVMLLYPDVVKIDQHGYYRVDYAALHRLDATL
jgi:hypothetical protein